MFCVSWSLRRRATEIDPESIAAALANVSRNGLEARIEVRPVASAETILCGVVTPDDAFDFCCCNPPFFETLAETGLNKKRASAATVNELTCPGGELAFVSRMIDDSASLRFQVRWFTTMLGRKATLVALKQRLVQTDGVRARAPVVVGMEWCVCVCVWRARDAQVLLP